ncbi:type II secretion system minor pseudopilin GspK [Phenylobacterium sp.]|uniref:type II secretion system minor pseudopilin GspK n=1 Tax=Phenylobacterium sp. TaxID=1871053 RepID=UPI0027317D89|nr:type II secretion system minor pseudopilin GspK [Phenylobacterium sp.]MDP2214168.1 type II secretion system minor pseudopilin GspK [Phenylobacterium sp.]
MSRRADKFSERGVALLTVLLLVAVLATLASVVLDDIRFGLRRAANAQAVGQARWYALGAETLAAGQIGALARAADRITLDGGWSDRPFSFPVENGLIQSRITDGAACFNLNSVVQGAGDVLSRRDLGVAQFNALLTALTFAPREAEMLAAALTDWIDSDGVRESGGAEDEAYLAGTPAYRTGGTLLAEVSELRAIRGFTPGVYVRLRPYVCALPTTDLSPINVNTLTSDKAVLITMLTEGAVGPELARPVIAARPLGGWSVEDFWRQPALVEHIPADPSQVKATTRFFTLQTQVDYLDAEVVASGLFEVDPSGQVRLAARRWTYDE